MTGRFGLILLAALGVVVLGAVVTHPTAQVPFLLTVSSGGGLVETARGTSLSNSVVSQTLTARGAVGALLVELPSRWSVVSFPASGSQGTASIAAEAAVRHKVDCVTWAGASSGAVAAAAGNLAVRDGATGAGTVIWQVSLAHLVAAAAGSQTIPVTTVCGLNLVGTTNTAMTAELNAGVTGEVQSVSMSGYNLQ